MSLRMLSLCSGIGGADLAASWTQKIEVIGQVECDPFCNQILAQHWPNVPRINFIEKVQGHEFGPVDLCIASIPCQPFSNAGKRAGQNDQRNLWPELRRILSAQYKRGTPYRWLIIENVRGLLSIEKGEFFKAIIQALTQMGYCVGWTIYGASEVGAPHRRERVFIVAHHDSDRQRQRQNQQKPKPQRNNQAFTCTCRQERMADTTEQGLQERRPTGHPTNETQTRAGMEFEPERRSNVADADRQRWTERGAEHALQQGHPRTTSSSGTQRDHLAHANPTRLSQRQRLEGTTTAHATAYRCTCYTRKTQSGMGRDAYEFSSRMDTTFWPARPGEQQHPGEPPRVIAPAKKLKQRVARLKALGNAIVPEQIYPLLQAIVNAEEIYA